VINIDIWKTNCHLGRKRKKKTNKSKESGEE